jgi:hypothetical protein
LAWKKGVISVSLGDVIALSPDIARGGNVRLKDFLLCAVLEEKPD